MRSTGCAPLSCGASEHGLTPFPPKSLSQHFKYALGALPLPLLLLAQATDALVTSVGQVEQVRAAAAEGRPWAHDPVGRRRVGLHQVGSCSAALLFRTSRAPVRVAESWPCARAGHSFAAAVSLHVGNERS